MSRLRTIMIDKIAMDMNLLNGTYLYVIYDNCCMTFILNLFYTLIILIFYNGEVIIKRVLTSTYL